MLKLRKNLKIIPPSAPGQATKVENPQTGKVINIGPHEVQILRLIAKYPIEEAAHRLEIERAYIQKFVEHLLRNNFLEPQNNNNSLQLQVPKPQLSAIEARPDLQFSQDADNLLIEDPLSNRFFTLGFNEANLFYQLLENPLEVVISSSGRSRVELQTFIDDLSKKGLLLRPALNTESVKPPQKTILSLFVQRFKLGNPDTLLQNIDSGLGWLWKGPLIGFHLAIILFGVFLWIDQGQAFQRYGFPKLIDNFWLNGLIFLSIVSIVLAVHEFAHGLTLKSFGGRVPEMGVFLLYGFPAAYTNVSGAYKLQEKSQRMWVVLAGVLFQAWMGSLAMIIWAFSAPHTWLSDLAYMFTFASWVNLAVNLNPLIKLDGYYLLTLFLNKPNLRANSWEFLKSAFKGANSFSEACLFVLYGLLSVIYTVSLFYFIVSGLLSYGLENMPFLSGLIVFLIVLASQTPLPTSENLQLTQENTIHRSLAKQSAGIPQKQETFINTSSQKNAEIHNRPPLERKRRPNFFPLILLIGLLFILCLKVPYAVGGEVEVNPSVKQRALIRSSINGVVQKIYVKPGDLVKAGDKLVEIVDWGLLDQISQVSGGNPLNGNSTPRLSSLNSQIEQQKIQTEKLKIELSKAEMTATNERKKAETYSKLAKEGAYPKTLAEQAELNAKVAEAEIQKLKEELNLNRELISAARTNYQTLNSQIQFYKQKADKQLIVSPISGYVLTEDTDLQQGDMTAPEKVLFTIADLQTVQVKIKVPQEDLPMVKEGQAIILTIKAFPGKKFKGIVSEIALASEDSRKADPTLVKDTGRKRWNVTMEINNAKLLLKPGMTGFAYIDSKQDKRIYELVLREAYRVLPLERFSVFVESIKKIKV